MTDFQLCNRHLNEIQRLASLVCDLDEDDLAVTPYNSAYSACGPAAKGLTEPHDIVFSDHVCNGHSLSLVLDIGSHKTRSILLETELPGSCDHS